MLKGKAICFLLCSGYYYTVDSGYYYILLHHGYSYTVVTIRMAIFTVANTISWLLLHCGYYGMEGIKEIESENSVSI